MAGRSDSREVDLEDQIDTPERGRSCGNFEDADWTEDEEEDEQRPLLSDTTSAPQGGDILQFSAPIYYADEDEDVIELEVIRLGSLKGTVSASYSTHDVTATSSQQYKTASGQITFYPGEHTHTIEVHLIQDGKWTPSTEFRISLTDPRNCALGLHLHAVRVKILNNDTFPSNSYKKDVHCEDSIRRLGDWGLFLSYCRFNFNSGGVKWQTILCLIFDQMSNICLFVTMCVWVYMVDILFAQGTSSSKPSKHLLMTDRYHTALVIAMWYVVPTFVLFAWDACKVNFDIKGTSRNFLMTSMIRMYLQYNPSSRSKVSATDLNLTVVENADALACSYVAAINIVQCLGKIVAVMVFICLFQMDHLAICTVLLMPLLLGLVVALRVPAFQIAQRLCDYRWRVLVMLANETCVRYKLIADYFKRHIMSDMFTRAASQHMQAKIPETYMLLYTLYSTKLISGFFIALYIVVRAPAVLDDDEPLSLGLFLATITIYGTYLADAITDLNNQLHTIIESFTKLQEITFFFNLPLELSDRKNVSSIRRQTTSFLRSQSLLTLKKSTSTDVLASTDVDADDIPLKISHVSFHSVLQDVNVTVEQGTMVAVHGPQSCGKATLMYLMSDIASPTSGHIFVPAHLRVLHVSREPMFLRMSLLHNLTLGLPSQHHVDLDRVQEILEKLDLLDCVEAIEKEFSHIQRSASRSAFATPTVEIRRLGTEESRKHLDIGDAHELADMDHTVMSWTRSVSHTQRMKLHLARALIANPNVMILQRPLQHFQANCAADVLRLFREHVRCRGLGYEADSVHSRRPRTLMLITETEAQAQEADVILQVDRKRCSKVVLAAAGAGEQPAISCSISNFIAQGSDGAAASAKNERSVRVVE